MKKHLQLVLFAYLLVNTLSFQLKAQCGSGTTRDTLNWDYLDFLPHSGAYVTPIPFISLSQSQNQVFTFGKLSVKVNHNYTGNNIGGDVTTHTGETGSFGKGADIRFRNDGKVTFTFSEPVASLQFSVYDIDFGQTISLAAWNGVVPVPINTTLLAGSILTVTGNGSPAVVAQAALSPVSATAVTPASNGTLNIEVASPVTEITLTATTSGTTTGEDASYYISDLSACAPGMFPLNYYHVAKPFVGQPAYFLAVMNNQVFYVNVANGVARLLFKDPGHTNINSLAYDPYRHMVYYSYSLTTNAQNDKKIFRFDYNLDTMGVMLPNVNTIGIPTYQTGVESGAAGFYDGAYYLGIEGNDGGGANSNRESIIWRIDFDSNYTPIKAAQVWATPVDDGNGTALHDWSDVGFNDGVMYDFDGASGRTDFYHKDLLTGSCINIKPVPSSLVPRQVSVTWAGQMYNSGSPSSSATGSLAPYLGNGSVNVAMQRTMTYQGVAVAGSWGDAGEAFKPKTDFGDAPASYDPVSIDPGTHERNDSIRIGAAVGIEWQKKTSANATGDGPEEDGVSGLQVVPDGLSNYLIQVKVYNITGRNAILAGWIDANGNGIYETIEGTTTVVPSGAGIQTVGLLWTGLNVTIPLYSTTFMRFRIATAELGLNSAKPNGYMDNGEIEDHPITSSLVLPDQQINLQARFLSNGQTAITWQLNDESGNESYQLESSCDARQWQEMERKIAAHTFPANYTVTDASPCEPQVYYRVKIIKSNQAIVYSDVVRLDARQKLLVSLAPNPVQDKAALRIHSYVSGLSILQLYDNAGRMVKDQKLQVNEGDNHFVLDDFGKLSPGTYQLRIMLQNEWVVMQLVVAAR